MIQVVGGCKLLEIRKELQKLMARGCQVALKLMAYQLHIKQKENLGEVRSIQSLTDKQWECKRLKAA
jgi:hypothetical protein